MRARSRRKTAEFLDGVTKNGNSTGGKKPAASKPNAGGKRAGGVTAARGGSGRSSGKMC